MEDTWEDDLMAAIRAGDREQAQRLLDTGATLQTYGKYGDTPLNAAAAQGDLEMIRLLLERGADACLPDDDGETPLCLALDQEHNAAVAALLNHTLSDEGAIWPADTDEQAAAQEQARLTALLLGRGQNINRLNKYDMTPLQMAVSHATIAKARLLLRAGAEVNATNSNDSAALIFAAASGHVEMAALLIDAGAEVNHVDTNGCGALYHAIVYGTDILLHRATRAEESYKGSSAPLCACTRTKPCAAAYQGWRRRERAFSI